MIEDSRPVEVDRSEARDWMELSLRQGFDLSSAVLASQTLDKGRFLVLVPGGFKRSPLNFAVGGVARRGSSEEALSKFLDEIPDRDAASVVVEHDMMRASDPGVNREAGSLAFAGERILHWCDLRSGGQAGAGAIVTGAHGYPLNAFVTKSTSNQLGLVDRQQIPDALPLRIVETLTAVVVSAFDNESFLIWMQADS